MTSDREQEGSHEPGERDPEPSSSDRLFREFLELQDTSGPDGANAEQFLRAHPEHDERLRDAVEEAAALEHAAHASSPQWSKDLDPRLATPLQGRYRIERYLARGGMSQVYLASDLRTDASVAIKVFNRTGEGDLHARFLGEARVGGRLSHRQRGTVRVFDLDALDDGTPYMVLEYVDGPSLATLLEAGPLTPTVAARLLGRLCDTLGAIHADGVFHCDLKPSNILIQPRADGAGDPVLIDFGVARVRGPLQVGPDTRSGEFRGTMNYASPESLDGQSGATSDQFSLGVVAYEMVTGHRPFRAETVMRLVDEIRDFEPPRADAVNPAVPAALADAIARAMSKKPEHRFASIVDFGRALERVECEAPAIRRPTTSPGYLLVAGAALLALSAAGVIAYNHRAARDSVHSAPTMAIAPAAPTTTEPVAAAAEAKMAIAQPSRTRPPEPSVAPAAERGRKRFHRAPKSTARMAHQVRPGSGGDKDGHKPNAVSTSALSSPAPIKPAAASPPPPVKLEGHKPAPSGPHGTSVPF